MCFLLADVIEATLGVKGEKHCNKRKKTFGKNIKTLSIEKELEEFEPSLNPLIKTVSGVKAFVFNFFQEKLGKHSRLNKHCC